MIFIILFLSIIIKQRMDNSDERQSIIALPLQERAVAVALKHIFDKIKKMQEQERNDVQAVKHQFIQNFKIIEDNSSKIIQGESIPIEYLNNQDKLFTEGQKNQICTLAKNNKKIQDYWSKVLSNFYGDDFSQADQCIAKALASISKTIFEDTVELIFQIEINEFIPAGKHIKKCKVEQDFISNVQGGVKWLKQKPQGIFGIILTEPSYSTDLNDAIIIATQFINEIVPYSLQHFLGASEILVQDQQLDEQQQSESEIPTKKIKE